MTPHPAGPTRLCRSGGTDILAAGVGTAGADGGDHEPVRRPGPPVRAAPVRAAAVRPAGRIALRPAPVRPARPVPLRPAPVRPAAVRAAPVRPAPVRAAVRPDGLGLRAV